MLSSIIIQRITVQVGEQSFQVRGLTFTDLSRLVLDHREDLIAAARIVSDAGTDDMIAAAQAIAGQLPKLTAAAIACAADDPGAVDTAGLLPLPVQLDALVAIGQLTFVDEGAVPKFLSNLKMLTSGLDRLKSQPMTR